MHLQCLLFLGMDPSANENIAATLAKAMAERRLDMGDATDSGEEASDWSDEEWDVRGEDD